MPGRMLAPLLVCDLGHTSLVAEHAQLAAYKTRCESRPTFQRALAAQLADSEERDDT